MSSAIGRRKPDVLDRVTALLAGPSGSRSGSLGSLESGSLGSAGSGSLGSAGSGSLGSAGSASSHDEAGGDPTTARGRPTGDGVLRSRAPVRREPRSVSLDLAALRVVGGLVALALLAAGVATFLFLRGRPGPVSARPTMSVTGAARPLSSSSASPSATASVVVVAVAGKVRRPGVVQLAAGSRVIDAIAAVGGALPGVDLTSVNLAAKLTDGEQVIVTGSAGAAAPVGGGGDGAGPVSLNNASVVQLTGLPGVGPVTAQRIVSWRTTHGGFQRVDQLQDVPGIGPAKFDQLKALVTL